jgi:hypothetical protein
MKFSTIATIAMALSLSLSSATVHAQQLSAAPITIKATDAPIRGMMESLFTQAGIKNYIIESEVSGFVTVSLTEQPMESALKLLMRANSLPLTYLKENDVWIVRVRRVPSPTPTMETPAPPQQVSLSNTPHYERISLTYLDPDDLSKLLGGITTIPSFSRQRGGQGFSSGQGLLGSGNGQLGAGQGQLGAGQGQLGAGQGQLGAGQGQRLQGSGSGLGQRLLR